MFEPAVLEKKSKSGFFIFLPAQILVWTTTAICRTQIHHFNRKAFKHSRLEKGELLPFSLLLILQALQTWAVLYP